MQRLTTSNKTVNLANAQSRGDDEVAFSPMYVRRSGGGIEADVSLTMVAR